MRNILFKKINVHTDKYLLVYSLLFVLIILALSIRGHVGNPNIKELNTTYWAFNGPLELSPERGRFALLYSLVEDKSVYFSLDVANLATPDLGYFKGKYVSLFAPGVSFIVMPGYILGKLFGASQLGAFAVIALFAIFNCALIYKICRTLGANVPASIIAFFIFIFGTPAFSYAVSLYQHHISTFIILLATYCLIKFNNLISLGVVWALCAISLSVDYPNLFMMIPIGIYALTKFFEMEDLKDKLVIKVRSLYFLSLVFAVLPAIFFFWFNNASYGSPTQLAGGITQVKSIDANGNPSDTNFTTGKPKDITTAIQPEQDSDTQGRNVVKFFNTRRMLNGLFILIFSPDRGLINYAPILIIGLIGVFYLYKRNKSTTILLTAVLSTNIILYSMWGDPWGGWAFGARYLIPGFSILSIFSAFFISDLKNKYLLIPVLFLFLYSVYINTSGALTSNALPPKVEVLALEQISGIPQKYTYQRNVDMIKSNLLKSAAYNEYFKTLMTGTNYFYSILGLIGVTSLGIFTYSIKKNEKNK